MKAIDVMTPGAVTIAPDADIGEAIKLLKEHDVSALPVVDDSGTVVGIISEADLVRRTEIGTDRHRPWWTEAMTPAAELAGDFAKAHGRKVHEVMTSDVVSASRETSLGEIASLLERNRIKRLPILQDGKLVGMVSRANLVQALAAAFPSSTDAAPADRAIRLDILDRLGDQSWTDFGSRNIIVKDGVVHLWGLVGSQQELDALTALVEEVPGVRKIVDETIADF
jgi:CBS domain-containing protein